LLSRPTKKGDTCILQAEVASPERNLTGSTTVAGKPWVAFFRFDGPDPAIHDKTWVLNDIEKTRQLRRDAMAQKFLSLCNLRIPLFELLRREESNNLLAQCAADGNDLLDQVFLRDVRILLSEFL